MDQHSLFAWAGTTTVAGVSVASLAIGIVAAVLAYLAMSFALRVALSRLARMAERTTNHADDMLAEVLAGTSRSLIAVVALLVGVGMLDLPDRWSGRVGQLWFIALALQIALWANRCVSIGLRRHALKHAATPSAPVSAAATLVSWGLRTLLWAIVLLAMLSNLGVNITAFVASLGVGGIAVALAAQNILGDLFASVAIATDKPFEVGDFIVLGSVAGTVELVGVKTTRIRSIGGEQIVMSNPRLRFDRAHFKSFGDSSLDYEVVYIVLDPGYGVYMDEQQRINLALMRELGERGIGFAFPTRTLHVASVPEGLRQVRPEEREERDARGWRRA